MKLTVRKVLIGSGIAAATTVAGWFFWRRRYYHPPIGKLE